MDGSAIVMMVLGIVIIWGGFAASLFTAIKKGKQR